MDGLQENKTWKPFCIDHFFPVRVAHFLGTLNLERRHVVVLLPDRVNMVLCVYAQYVQIANICILHPQYILGIYSQRQYLLWQEKVYLSSERASERAS